ncbi:hypothetical protein JTE90_016820 [Oedothorax gibbosus]|uniref:Ninjurin-2 n=1 Tax=Oedothorax gibbosus TaxID=931172 RepID=A0AAV6VYR8_9ARAC|nr:hypothetical protein JTE90_016820 [Oedothorax gibbosus]
MLVLDSPKDRSQVESLKLEEEMKEFLPNSEENECKICRCRKEDTAVVVEAKVEMSNLTKSAGSHVMTRRITIAGGFLDIALFTANCEQLKFVLELGKWHIYYNEVLGLLITSLVLQLLVGLTMFLLGCQVVHKVSDETYSNFLNHATMGLVALITIVNIFINIFGPKGSAIAYCLGAFSYPNTNGPIWNSYLNYTWTIMKNMTVPTTMDT